MRRRLSELAGLALIVLALLGAIALATWSVQDPSLSHATQKPMHNLLGFPGAIFSDLAMQLLGLAAILISCLRHCSAGACFPTGPSATNGAACVDPRHLACRRLSHRRCRARLLAAADRTGRRCGDAVLRLPAMVLGAPWSA